MVVDVLKALRPEPLNRGLSVHILRLFAHARDGIRTRDPRLQRAELGGRVQHWLQDPPPRVDEPIIDL